MMHEGEIETDVALVRRLLAGQFPQWADLPIDLIESYGTDHDIYRLGDELVARLPRIGWATEQAAKEAQWLPRLRPHLPLEVPLQVAIGHPAEGYPFDWSVCRWLPGENANGTIDDLDQAAVDLAAFVKALRQIDTTGAHPRPPHGRGGPLAEGDEAVRHSIAQLGDRIDGPATLRSWEESLDAPEWEGEEVWVHGDLLPGNLLVCNGRLSAVIDFGGLNVGDPACDLQPAWNVFAGTSRARFRSELQVDEASWLRGRGWALCQAVMALPYYWETNPGMIRQASHALAQVIAEGGTSPERRRIVISDHQSEWPALFERIAEPVRRAVADLPADVEHVGSTAVPGLAAKPVIDIDVVVRTLRDVPMAIERLRAIGYIHQGDKGIAGREAFRWPPDTEPHHLYVVVSGNAPHADHIQFRDFLRGHPQVADRYAKLKNTLADRYADDRSGYTDAKSEFIAAVLAAARA